MNNLMLLEQKLRRANQSYTKPRQLVFVALEDQEPMAMSDLVARVDKSVDRASVYRTVKLFEELGIIHKLQIGWKYKLELSDDFHDHHHHIACVKCGAIQPVHEDEQLEQSIYKLASAHDFSLLTHQLELRGICKNCQKS
jgi:Fur family ferric uptake transcriptional regulator